MTSQVKFWFCTALLLCISLCIRAEDTPVPVSSELLSDMKTINPGSEFTVMVKFTIQPGFHLYWKNPGESGAPPQISWTLPSGIQAGEVLWPTPSRIEVDHTVLFGYSNECDLLVLMKADDDLQSPSQIDLQADVSWVACGSVCIPGKEHLQLALDINDESVENKALQSSFIRAKSALPKKDIQYLIEEKDEASVLKISPEKGSFSDVQSVLFFPEDGTLFDPHFTPKWKLSPKDHKLVVELAPKRKGEVKGTLVVSFSSDSMQKDLAIDVSQENAIDANTVATSVSQKLRSWFSERLERLKDSLGSEFAYILVLAFIGGALLNIMPCVLPVISLKVLHFMRMQGQSRGTTFKHGLAFSFGVLLSFWMLAGAIFILQAFGKTVGWGFQLQEPFFVAGLVVVLFIFALSLFGVFEFGTKIASIAAELDEVAKVGSPLASELPTATSSFFSGVLATFVASPCTGPLLGSTIGFTAMLSPVYAFMVFTSLGIGMAFPYLLLSLFPGLMKVLPKPGRWMVTFKQLMGFFMLATVLWLIWVLQAETNQLSFVYIFSSFFLMAFGFWIYGTWAGFERKNLTRAIAKVISFFVVVGGILLLFVEVKRAKATPKMAVELQQTISAIPGKEWEPYSQKRLDELRKEHIPVFLDVTAKWCLTCQTNALVLESEAVRKAFIQYGVVKMMADWTQNDEAITKMLRSLGRNGVPVYALYGKNPEVPPTILPELITQDMVIDALKILHDEK